MVFGRRGAEKIRFGPDPHAVEVQTVGIPAGLDGNVAIGSPIGVVLAGGNEELKVRIGKMEMRFPENTGQFCGPAAVAVIAALIDPPGIMEQGKQFYHLDHGPGPVRQPAAIFPNSGPMGNPMDSVQRQKIYSARILLISSGGIIVFHGIITIFRERGKRRFPASGVVFGNSDVSPFILMKPEA